MCVGVKVKLSTIHAKLKPFILSFDASKRAEKQVAQSICRAFIVYGRGTAMHIQLKPLVLHCGVRLRELEHNQC